MSNQTQKIYAAAARLETSAFIDLYILDASEIGGEAFYFYDGTAEASSPELPNPPVRFQGIAYHPLPVELKGVEIRAKGELPRPQIRFSNIMGTFTSLSLLFEDLVGARLIRKRTLRTYLDDGEDPTPDAELPPDIFVFERKISENRLVVEYELVTILELEGVTLPGRVVTANICSWFYRSSSCGVADNHFVADSKDRTFPFESALSLKNYYGLYDEDIAYPLKAAVGIVTGGEEHFYVSTSSSPLTGVSPLTPGSPWRIVQRYRGLWKARSSNGVPITYYTGDVVYIVVRGIRQLFVLTVPSSVGEASAPPNKNIWVADQCGKRITSCKLRQDPLLQNKLLTFGAFPGVSKVQEV